MPCEHDQDALVAAAATPELRAELLQQLGECAWCRAAFERELSLLESIDSGLREIANQSPHPALFPRIGRALAGRPGAARGRLSGFALAALASAAALFLFAALRPGWPGAGRPASPTVSLREPPFSPVRSRPGPAARLEQQAELRPARPTRRSPSAAPFREKRAEILVPAEQELLLAGYAQEWRSRSRDHRRVASGNSMGPSLAPLELPPIQIDPLDVKLLAEQESR